MDSEVDVSLNLSELKAVEPYQILVDGVPVIVAPYGWVVHALGEHLAQPTRIKATMQISSLKSFMEYVNRFKEPNTIIRLTQGRGSCIVMEAIIDYHGAPSAVIDKGNRAAWCDHTAILKTADTAAWDAWSSFNGSWMRQSEFADFIYDNKQDIFSPIGADLLEIVQTLRAHSKGVFKDMKFNNGSYEVISRLEVKATGGTEDRPQDLPERFSIGVQIFHGGPTVPFSADIKIKVPNSDEDPLLMQYKLYRLNDVLENMLDSIEADLVDNCGVPVYRRAG